jgi:hypothetical protein
MERHYRRFLGWWLDLLDTFTYSAQTLLHTALDDNLQFIITHTSVHSYVFTAVAW